MSTSASGAASDGTGVAIRGGGIRVVGYASGVLVSLGSAAIMVRHLGLTAFGSFVTVTSLIGLVGGVTEAGIYVYGIREFGLRAEDARHGLIANLLGMRVILSIAGVGVALCFALVVGYRQVLVLGAVIAGAGLVIQVTADVLSIPLQSQLRLGRLTAVDLVRRVIALMLTAALALVGASLLPFFAAPTFAGAAALALLAWIIRSSITIRMSFDRQAWRELFLEMLPYAVVMSIGAIYFYITVILMSLIASAHQTGLFGTSFRITQVALGVPALLLTAIFPLMARRRRADQIGTGEAVSKVLTVAVICGVWMSLAMGLGAGFVIHLIAGSKGRGAVSVLQIQGLVFIASFVSTASGLTLLSLQRYRSLLIASAGALVLNIVLAAILIPSLGAKGGSIADVVSEAAVATVMTVVLLRAVPEHQIKPSQLIPVVFAASLSTTVLLIPISSLGRALTATVIYFGALLMLGAIPAEVTDAARRWRGARHPA
jgi:O-antigen/teichoic acid export membrane protein